MKKIYVASSWRNEYQPIVVTTLRSVGFYVYDFKDSDGFKWSEVDLDYKDWVRDQNIKSYLLALNHPTAVKDFMRDMSALNDADICVYVAPCGVSASLELGYAVGKGKLNVVYLPELREPELMLKMAGYIFTALDDMVLFLKRVTE